MADSRNVENRKLLKYFVELHNDALYKLGRKSASINIKKLQFVHSVNSDGLKTAKKSLKGYITQHHIQAVWWYYYRE